MSKLVLTSPASFVNDASAVAQEAVNNQAIMAAMENTLSRDGTAPNQMISPLDMNSQRIINLPVPSFPTDPVRLQDTSSVSVGAYTAVGGVTRLTASKFGDTINVKDYGAVGDFVTDDTAAINAALAAAHTAGVGTVFLGGSASVHMVSSAILMQPGVKLVGPGTIKQKAIINLSSIVNFGVFVANGASLSDCTVDGNRANNTDDSNVVAVSIVGVDDVEVAHCTIRNTPGLGIYFVGGKRPKIHDNYLTNLFGVGVTCTASTPNTKTYGQIYNNTLVAPFRAGLYCVYSDYNEISNNNVIGSLAGGPGNLLRVNTNGTAVTWVSGPTFTAANNITAGLFIVLNGGAEYLITSVNSSTSLTVSSAIAVLSNTLAAIGPGDMISIDSASFAKVLGNYTFGGVTGGIVVSDATGGQLARGNLVGLNTLDQPGTAGISVSGAGSGVASTALVNNILRNCGQSGSAHLAAALDGIYVVGSAVTDLFVNGNATRDDQGISTTAYWLYLDGVTANETKVGFNNSGGVTNGTSVGGASSYYTPSSSNTWINLQLFNSSMLGLKGSSSGFGTLNAPAAASTYVWTLPAATGTLLYSSGPLGVPSSGDAANLTGTASGLTAGSVTTNANLTGAITSVGNAASLGSFTSANLRAALTDEVGTGAAYFVGGALGTPASGTATNLTGLPLTTGVTGTLPVANGGTGNTGGAWTATTPTVSPIGGPGAFAATSVLHTLQEGKKVYVQLVVTITNIGTATGFSVPYPVPPSQVTALAGTSLAGNMQNWYSGTGQIFQYNAVQTPVATTYYISGVYEAA